MQKYNTEYSIGSDTFAMNTVYTSWLMKQTEDKATKESPEKKKNHNLITEGKKKKNPNWLNHIIT